MAWRARWREQNEGIESREGVVGEGMRECCGSLYEGAEADGC
jgi:hypothetical protein